ncbi:hypothetical protein [Dyadobacter sp. NIV53]|uniref:hypothetical protein n=1 Tax=Dyadobacter sp. NIV53 TaxID=2861765 RepID=UPI001C888C8C|nr:hypothetical protein [Dyadobacter sp. NIV53]
MNVYLVAGPPGIGKSTNAKELIPKGIPIIDQDLAGYQYKKLGFNNYHDLASFSSNQKIKDHVFSGEDFALELNLGFPSHYDYLKSILSIGKSIQVHLILFFTDNLELCFDRARIRHLNGGHEVKPDIIKEMYDNTIPFFNQNRKLFYSIRLIDVTDNLISEYPKNSEILPQWIVRNNFQIFFDINL